MKKKQFKIIIINIYPGNSKFAAGKEGGGQRMVEILKRLQTKYQVEIYSTNYVKKVYRQYGLDKCKYNIVNTKLTFHNKFDLSLISIYLLIKAFLFKNIYRDFNKNQNIIVYSSSDLFWETIPAFILKIKNPKIKWIQIIHHIYPNWNRRCGNKIINFLGYYLQYFSHKMIAKKADLTITINPNNIEPLISRGFKKEKIKLSYNGISLNSINKIKVSPKTINYDGVFLGRLNHSKGVFDLIEIWKKVVKENNQSKLAIIGAGPKEIENQLKLKIKQNKLEKNIFLLGYLKENEKISILKNSKVFVFPSHEEGWGIAISEAMACKLVVVAYNLKNYYPIYKDSIVYIEENDYQLFAKKINLILNNSKLRENLKKSAYNLISQFDWDKISQLEFNLIK